ncbi:MAG: tripartite tricarboxylate transporter substrate binding protein [Betaproteobacteria bacterium]|nr:tripartite tricarboxylate transporter substrate binding protein [Betaproteobacteria bacterium]
MGHMTFNQSTLALWTLAVICATPAWAQDYPLKAINIVVPAAAGGGLDRVARLLADKFRAKWGQPVVVENRAGAAGIIGSEFVAKAAPDGYTLLFAATGQLVINKSLYANLNFDPDLFVPVSLVTAAPNVLVVHPKVAAENVQQLIAYARANPDKLSYASQGTGTTQHLSPELLKAITGINMVHVPYKGGAPALTDLLGGQVDMMFTEISSLLPHLRAGKLRALGVGSERRNAALPNVPAMSEIVPGFVSMTWQGMVAPAGTQTAIANRLSAATAEALKQADLAKLIAEASLESIGSTPVELAQFMRQERERWGKVIRAIGAKAD